MAAPNPDAPAVLAVHANGSVVLQIVDHEGEALDYLLEPAPAWLDGWACVLRRLDGKGGPHRVSRSPRGWWRCSCADARFRAPAETRKCKHALALSKLYPFMKRMMANDECHNEDETQAG